MVTEVDEKKFLSQTRSEFEDRALEIYVQMSDSTELRVLQTFAPKETRNGFILFIVAGWGSVVLGWEEVLLEAMKDFDIVYLETREKGSSKLTNKSVFGLDRMSQDIKETIFQLSIDEKKLILFGSCMGATVIANGLAKKMFDPFLSILVSPPPRFEMPPLTRYLVPITPRWLLKPIKPMLRFWVRKFKSESSEQAAKYIRVINEADGYKWKKVGKPLALGRYWKIFPLIESRVLVVAAEKDKMHDAKTIQKIVSLIPGAIYRNLETNHNTHAPIMVETIREVINQLTTRAG